MSNSNSNNDITTEENMVEAASSTQTAHEDEHHQEDLKIKLTISTPTLTYMPLEITLEKNEVSVFELKQMVMNKLGMKQVIDVDDYIKNKMNLFLNETPFKNNELALNIDRLRKDPITVKLMHATVTPSPEHNNEETIAASSTAEQTSIPTVKQPAAEALNTEVNETNNKAQNQSTQFCSQLIFGLLTGAGFALLIAAMAVSIAFTAGAAALPISLAIGGAALTTIGLFGCSVSEPASSNAENKQSTQNNSI